MLFVLLAIAIEQIRVIDFCILGVHEYTTTLFGVRWVFIAQTTERYPQGGREGWDKKKLTIVFNASAGQNRIVTHTCEQLAYIYMGLALHFHHLYLILMISLSPTTRFISQIIKSIVQPIVSFHMTSLKSKLKKYRSYRDFTFTMHQNVKERLNLAFCWAKNSTVWLTENEHSRPIAIKCARDFAVRHGLTS